jgi:DNA-binding transcriptional LysR family regulator
MLDARRLRVLVEVARRGSFSGAAAALGYTQPAISRQIATLEAEVGAGLVRRVPQGAVLTDAGRMLVDRSEPLLAQLGAIEAELRSFAELECGELRIASFASAAASIVPLAIARFRQRHGGIELGVVMGDPIETLPRLVGGELDIVLSHDACGFDGVELIHLFDDPMYVAMPMGHRLADAEPLELQDFAVEPWMLATTASCPDSRLFLQACHAAGFEPQIAFQNDDYPAMLGFVAAGVGVALVPDMVARGAREDVVIRQLDPAAPSRLIHAALPAGYRSPAATAMVAVLREVGEEWVDDRLVFPRGAVAA